MDIVIILGKRLNDDGSMTDELKRRLDKGLEIFKEIKDSKIVVSGGMPNKKAKRTEASMMREYLLSLNVKDEDIVVEDKSLTTYSNAWKIKKIFKGHNIDSIYLVSTKYHFERKIGSCYRIFRRNFKNVCINCVMSE